MSIPLGSGSLGLQGGSNSIQLSTSPQSTAPIATFQDAPNYVQPDQGYSLPITGSAGGGGGGGTNTTPTYDPAAAAAKAAAAAEATRLAQGTQLFNTQLGTVRGSAGSAASTSSGDLKTSILQYLDSLGANQTSRNNTTIQDYLAKEQGTQGVYNAVGRGIHSGGVLLSNSNAQDSSANKAIADAYGVLGRQQLGSVNGQFAQAENAVKQGHDADVVALGSKLRDLPQAQTDIVNTIVSDAQQKLGDINTQMAYMSLPDRVDMEAEKTRITNDVMSKLQGLDQILSGGSEKLNPIDTLSAQQQAGSLYSAGVAPSTAFNFDTNVPVQLQNTGPFSSDLPLFSLASARKQTA